MDNDEDEKAQVIDDDEDGTPGSEGEGAEGQDEPGRDEEGDLSAQRPDQAGDEGASPQGDARQPQAQPRRSERYQRLANENRDYRERLERLEREREQERRQYQQQQQAATEQQERERLALMTPEERSEYTRTRDRQYFENRLQQQQFTFMSQMDKSNFDSKAASNPVYKRMQAAVEQRFQHQMSIGQPTDRETILKYLLGEQALDGAGNPRPARQARRRVEGQRVAPSNNRGEAGQRSGARASSAEERLKDVLI